MRPYTFAVLRYVHDVSSQEFVNVGLAMWDHTRKVLRFRVNERYGRVARFFPDFDGNTYRQLARHLSSHVEQRIERLAQPDLFETTPESLEKVLAALLPEDSSCFQWSAPMSGIADDPQARFEALLQEFVFRLEGAPARERRDELAIWQHLADEVQRRDLWPRIRRAVRIATDQYDYSFRIGWQNGQLNVAEPISFDLTRPQDILEKANTWAGRLFTLSRGNDFKFTAIVAPPRDRSSLESFEKCYRILKNAPTVHRIVPEEDLGDFVAEVQAEAH